MALCDRRFVFAIALTAACTPDFEASSEAGAGGMPGGSSGTPSTRTSGGSAGTKATGGSSGTLGGASARGGSTGSGGTASDNGGGDDGGTGSSGGTDAAGGATSTGGNDAAGGSGNTSGSNPGGAGGTVVNGGRGGGGGLGALGGMAGLGLAGLGAAGSGTDAGTGGTVPVAGAPNGGSGGGLGGCDNQLLANADFEAGPTPSWSEESSWPGIEIIVAKTSAALATENVTPYAGNFLAWLGGIPDNDWDHHLVILTQDVTLPADAATLTLSGRRWVKSDDDDSEEFDVAYLEFDDEAGDVAWQAQAWSNQSTTTGWVSFTSTTSVEAAYRGKKLTFVAYSNTDPGGKTSFFLDNLELVASCGR